MNKLEMLMKLVGLLEEEKCEKENKVKNEVMSKTDYGNDYYIIRTHSAGVFYGKIAYRKGKEAMLIDSRRIWYWDGAFELTEMALTGVKKPQNCKFSMKIVEREVTEVIEILKLTNQALDILNSVKDYVV